MLYKIIIIVIIIIIIIIKLTELQNRDELRAKNFELMNIFAFSFKQFHP